MMYYARSDTHYLLYIYDHLRNALIDASEKNDPDGPLERALHRSKELSLSRHEHPGYDDATGEGSRGWYNYVLKHAHLSYNSEQFAVFQALWRWRDQVARAQDESINFVMGLNPLCEIARVNPPDIKALHSLIPTTAPLAKPRLNEMWEEIKQQKSKNGPSLLKFLTSQAPDDIKKSGASKIKSAMVMPAMDGEVVIGRLPSSQLFGNMAISSRWESSKEATENGDDHVPFPWQRFVEQVSEIEINDTEPTPAQDNEETPVPAAAEPEQMADEEFTLKQGKKRKAPSDNDSDTSSSGSESDDDEEMDDNDGGVLAIDTHAIAQEARQARKQEMKADRAKKATLKKQKKEAERLRQQEARQKKEEKKAKRAAEKEAKEVAKEQAPSYNAVPFDYGAATSVLHGKRDNNDAAAGGRKPKKAFNPYAKSAEEGVKGARKAPPIKGERSATFKK